MLLASELNLAFGSSLSHLKCSLTFYKVSYPLKNKKHLTHEREVPIKFVDESETVAFDPPVGRHRFVEPYHFIQLLQKLVLFLLAVHRVENMALVGHYGAVVLLDNLML